LLCNESRGIVSKSGLFIDNVLHRHGRVTEVILSEGGNCRSRLASLVVRGSFLNPGSRVLVAREEADALIGDVVEVIDLIGGEDSSIGSTLCYKVGLAVQVTIVALVAGFDSPRALAVLVVGLENRSPSVWSSSALGLRE
jgi:hypothetical protein